MRILITGVSGQVGGDARLEAARRGHEVMGCDLRPEGADAALDITDGAAVRACLRALRPDAVLHCAAWTAVDAAEEPENRAKVFAVNEAGTRNLAEAAAACGAKMLYLSTDYVFGGGGERPWTADERAFAPKNVYGESKLAGERAAADALARLFIVRTAWVFGASGKNFVRTMLRLGETHEEVRVVCDQIGTPTYAKDLVRLLVDMLETDRFGVYHATNEGGYVSWCGFAAEIFRRAGMKTRAVPVTTAEYGLSRAARPLNSRLDKSKLAASGFRPLPPWQDALARYLAETGYGSREG